MAEEEAQGEEGKKKKPLLLIIVAVNVLLAGGAAAFIFMRGGGEAPPAEGAPADGGSDPDGDGADGMSASGKGAARAQGPLVEFAPIVVNLNEPEGARYLKIQIFVQLANDKFSDDVERAKPIVRDAFIRELSDLNFRQTMGNKAKLAIKRRLLKRFNESMGADAAVDIHITQFIVQ